MALCRFMKPHACRCWTVVLLAALVFLPPIGAQDVIVGEPGWFQADGIPDQQPRTERQARPEYPCELRDPAAGETGYVIAVRYLDAKGQTRELDLDSAYPWFKAAVEKGIEGWQMAPARRGGQPVPSWFWQPIIFNAKSAGPDQPEATPRLLAVTPVIVPSAIMKKMQGKTTAWGTLSLDAAGVPQKVVLEPGTSDRLLPFVEAALRQWRVAPARKDGQPVAAELRVAFLVYPPMAPVPTNLCPPRVDPRSQKQPIYPRAMATSGIEGRVLVVFVVDKEGRVRNPVVDNSNNPAFDEPAIECVLKWKFEPATVDGEPVNTRMSVPIIFGFDRVHGQEAYTVDSPSWKAKERMPEELVYDVNPKILGIVNPVFPYAALRDDKKGRAAVLLAINPTGNVVQTKVIEAALPEFGLALAAAAETFKFDPALKNGNRVRAVLKIEQEFSSHAENRIITDDDLALLRLEKKKPESIVGANKLDAPLRPLSRRSPVFPLALRGKADHGEARIELLIDEKGHPRLPRIAAASDPAFGYAAVQAAAQWLFEPPMSGGKPAIVRVIVPFAFEIKPATTVAPADGPAAPAGAGQN